MKQQVFIIHGGDSFNSYEKYWKFLKGYKIDIERYRAGNGYWKESIHKDLGKNYEVFLPQMPNRNNARYKEWKLWFEKLVSYMKPGVILVGHSLGGIFLTKYLAENAFPKRLKAVFIIAAPFGEGDLSTPKSFRRLRKLGERLIFYQSKDDTIVPFEHIEKYMRTLPNAQYRLFKDRWHFVAKEFPELVRDIKKLVK